MDVKSDIIEQQAWNKNGTKFIHYKIYIAAEIPGDSIGIFKINKVNETMLPKSENNEQKNGTSGPQLAVSGFTEFGQVLFNYQNGDQGID